jgi:uncharacterized protein with PIN domain
VKPFTVRLRFYGDLVFFLRSGKPIERQLTERASIKDVIEACGVPHPEVDLIVLNGRPTDFAEVIGTDAKLHVYPTTWERFTLFPENRIQSARIQQFVADGHLGKLVRDLRLLGIDVLYERDAQDRQLLDLAGADNRALLTRDRRLLMHAVLRHGYYLRSQNPFEQTIEVLRRFALASTLDPFTRCLACNAPLEHVDKAEVFDRLEPLTKIYYERFRRCPGCGQIYWQGSHFDRLRGRVEDVRTAMANAKEK